MSIRRGKRPDTRFYTLNKDISEDTRLSWAARGMLIFLLGKPDNWTVSVAHLIKQTAESQRPSSRDAVRGIIAELVSTGYMKADTARAENGKFRGMDYVVCESPETENPSPDNPQQPEPEKPSPGEPLPDNPPLINNDHHQGLINPTSNDSAASQNCAADGAVSAPEVFAKPKQLTPERITEVAWERFTVAYEARYGVPPVRNARINSQMKKLVECLGKEAPAVACFYVRDVNDQFVIKNSHPLGILLKGAEGYRTQWATGRAMTNTRASQIDQTAANFSAADEAKAMLRAKRERERANNAE